MHALTDKILEWYPDTYDSGDFTTPEMLCMHSQTRFLSGIQTWSVLGSHLEKVFVNSTRVVKSGVSISYRRLQFECESILWLLAGNEFCANFIPTAWFFGRKKSDINSNTLLVVVAKHLRLHLFLYAQAKSSSPSRVFCSGLVCAIR